MKRNYFLGLILSCLWAVTACDVQSDYETMVNKQLITAKENGRVDSLFLDIHFGMKNQDFFEHCWNLNKKELVTSGPKNQTVEYKLDAFDYPAVMNFYPEFTEEGKIYKMGASFAYVGWAPWNRHLFADSLQPKVVELMRDWYDIENFLEVKSKERGSAFVAVQGNRRISVYVKDDTNVGVSYTDLLAEVEESQKPTDAK